MRERISPVFTLLLALLAILLVVFGTGLINQNLSRPARILIEELPAARDQQVFPPLAGERLIRVGVEEDFAPFSYWQNGRASGFDVDLMLAVAEQEGLQVEFIPAARQELRRMIAEGELDAIAGIAFSPARDQEMDFSTSYAALSMGLFARVDSPIRSLADAADASILVKEGGITHDYLRENPFGSRVVAVPSNGDALRLLAAGEYDAALLPRMQALRIIRNQRLNNLRLLDVNFETYPYGFAVTEGNTDLLLSLNEGLAIVQANGEFDRLYERWFGDFESLRLTGVARFFVIALAATGVLLVIAIAWTRTLRRQVRLRTQELRKSEEEYRLLVENASEGVAVICQDQLVFHNPRLLEILGYSKEELAGVNALDLIHPDDREQVSEFQSHKIFGTAGKEPLTCRLLTRKGESRWVLLNSVRIHWKGKPATLNLVADISEIKQAEERITRQLQHMAALRAVDMAIAGNTDVNRTLRLLLEQVTGQLGVDAADILLVDRQTGKLKYAAHQGFRTRAILSAEVAMGEGYAGKAAAQGHPVLVACLRGTPRTMLSAARLESEGFYAYYCTPLIAKGAVLGVLEVYHRTPLPSDQQWMDLIETMAHQGAIALDNASLVQDLEKINEELVQAYDRTIEGWAHALELRDGETEGHSRRVLDLTIRLARRMGVPEEELVHIRRGALLHDMGKMGIPDEILLKNGPLDAHEWEVMRRHPTLAYEMLSRVTFLEPALDIPYCHHENWDGSGYPRGLKGEEIPLAARIFAIVDVWDALSVRRPYRDAWPEHKIWSYILAQSGRQFDPQVVQAFVEMMKPELVPALGHRALPLAAD